MNLYEYVQSIESATKTWEKSPHVYRQLKDKNAECLFDVKFGQFKVFGYSPILKRWIVKCSCGFYESRTSKAIKNPKNIDDKCSYCRRTDRIVIAVPNLKGVFDFMTMSKNYKALSSREKNEKTKNNLMVTQHACERYIERVEAVTMLEAEKMIQLIVRDKRGNLSGDFKIVSNGYCFAIRGNRVTTVFKYNKSR